MMSQVNLIAHKELNTLWTFSVKHFHRFYVNHVSCIRVLIFLPAWYLEFVESQQRSFLPSGKGKLLHSFMMGTAEDVDDSESVSLIEFMEEQNILIAKQHRFIGIMTTNTNPLTMV